MLLPVQYAILPSVSWHLPSKSLESQCPAVPSYRGMVLDPTEVSNKTSIGFIIVFLVSLQQSQKEKQLSGYLYAKKTQANQTHSFP